LILGCYFSGNPIGNFELKDGNDGASENFFANALLVWE